MRLPIKKALQQLWRATGYSCQGLACALKERAFRWECYCLVILTPLAFILANHTWQLLLMIGSMLLVLIVELLNSAIETTIDRISQEHHPLSGKAKDLASAAVFLAIVNVAFIWIMILIV